MSGITTDDLERWFGGPSQGLAPERRYQNAWRIGGLAPWWLSGDELRSLDPVSREIDGADFPRARQAPDEPGDCVVLALLGANAPRLRPAVVLPLTWRCGAAGHDRRLPAALASLADRVRGELAPFLNRSGSRPDEWTLHWNARESPDLSALPIAEDSAWGALFSGLVLAVEGIRPRPEVWITAAGDVEQGLSAVDLGDRGEKLQTARDFGAAVVFVPPQTLPDARRAIAVEPGLAGLEVRPVWPQSEASVERMLQTYLQAARQEPGNDDPFELRRRYYLNIEPRSKARPWFYSRLLHDMAGRLERRGEPPPERVDDLVLAASGGLEIGATLCAALRPRRVWLWYDPAFLGPLVGGASERLTAEILGALEHLVPSCRPEIVPLPVPGVAYPELTTRFRQFFQCELPPGTAAIDVTAGTKLMSIGLAETAPPGAWLVYVQNESDPVTNRAFPSALEMWCKAMSAGRTVMAPPAGA